MRSSKEVERRILQHLKNRSGGNNVVTEIHGHIIRHNLHHSNQILSHLISSLSKSKSKSKINYAHLIFIQTQHPNITVFNSIIKAYSLSPSHSHLSLLSFNTMKKTNTISADEFTFPPLFKSCANISHLIFAKALHGQVFSHGFCGFKAVTLGLLEVYVNCGNIMDDAKKLFDEMPERDVIVWNLMIRGFFKVGNVDMGFSLFRNMTDRNVVSWNTMLSCLSKCGRHVDALKVFRQMRDDGVQGDEATVVTMLPVCVRLGDDETGVWIHSYAKSSGLYVKHVSVGNSLVDFYCKRGLLDAAFVVFDDMPLKNVVSWNAMISGLAFNGKAEKGLALFDEMINNGFNPNESTFVGVMTCCVHSGLIQRGRELFSSMVSNHHIQPKLEHYGCMVDLLGRGGLVKEAYDFLKSMPMKPNAALWGALLSSCRNHGDNKEIAEIAVKELIVLEPLNSGNYVLLSNMYAERGKWEEVDKVRVLMQERNIDKAPGQSIIRNSN